MLIGSVIKPVKGKTARNITLFDTDYAFADTHKNGHFIAEVADEQHAKVLLANEAYYAYNAKAPPPVIKRPERATASVPVVAEPPAPPEFTPEQQAEAQTLLKLNVETLGKELGKVSSLAVVRAALVLENASDKPRTTAVKLLEDTLTMAAQASGTGQGA